ncbi:MAG: NAD(P)H-dependent oxidoreductase subunit E [Anaerolineaceae bacterium]|nr:NAD(P)H-dependent oxidoreductase subunit E [Anaerolineaceae bacterium]
MNEILNKYSEEIERILAKYPPEQKRSAVMPLLIMAQRDDGYVSQKNMDDISEILSISRTEVATIVGFYTLFHEKPGGRYHIQVCTDISCALRGADQYFQELCDYLGLENGGTTEDGLVTLEAVMCLASCHKAPMFQLQGDGKVLYHDHQTFESTKAFIEELRHLKGVETDEKEKDNE